MKTGIKLFLIQCLGSRVSVACSRYVCIATGFTQLYYIIYYCYFPSFIIIEPLTVLSADINLINRREVGYAAEKYDIKEIRYRHLPV